MAHLSGLILIDCPASALNNAGQQLEMVNRERRYDNWSTIKKVETRQGVFPYVSAQAFRYWMRETLKDIPGWTPSPTFREEKIAYTDANPILYAEDDLFGYMRAPGEEKKDAKSRRERWAEQKLTEQEEKKEKKFVTLTRNSPFKVSTLMSIAPLRSSEIGFDYGTMARTDDPEFPNPVPYVHEFYRTTLAGLFSIDLRMLGRFYFVERTGYRHLDAIRKELAKKNGLKLWDNDRAYELDLDVRRERLRQLLEGLARITGGAKQAVHYTDISPRLLLLGIAKGGNHLFGTAVGATRDGSPVIKTSALAEVAQVFKSDLLSEFYAGLAQGYLDEQRAELQKQIDEIRRAVAPDTASGGPPAEPKKQANGTPNASLGHPVEAIRHLIQDLDKHAPEWLA